MHFEVYHIEVALRCETGREIELLGSCDEDVPTCTISGFRSNDGNWRFKCLQIAASLR